MWILTPRGFFSVVAHHTDGSMVLVRARVEEDLLALRDLAPGIDPWHDSSADYAWRAELPRDEWADVASALASEIDYGNFKDAVAARQGAERAHVYTDVWSALRRLQR